MVKQVVFLPGASGSMGHQAFLKLWELREQYDIVLLQRPSKKNKKLFAPFEKICGIKSIPGKGIVEGNGLKIVWGDATNYEDVLEDLEYWNAFLTKEEAQKELEKRKAWATIKKWSYENDLGYEWMDWKDNYFIEYNYIEKKLRAMYVNNCKMNLQYYSSYEKTKQAIKELDKEYIILFWLE